ncbi:MAG: DNA-directed RNA polymerases II 24 kDa polypeptide (RNA polymerase II subunit 5) [Cyphobasidiales sp. Tagirdzhanova-0007]|nr:MAG: DNA-directed RNA polymerases II 24 kDa polypeptide (RNA polymerase II subunit 5) [Cyphobasidiales sp. Tagirdzhanova-0007]
MEDQQRQVSRLHRVNRTVKEMIRDRKYGVSQEEIDIVYEDFSALHASAGIIERGSLSMLSDNELNRCVAKFSSYSKSTLNFQAQNEAGEKIYVYYSDEEKKAGVGIKPIRRILEVLDEQHIKKGLFIYDGKLTPAASKAISNVKTELGIDVEAFQEAELLVNITHHELVPTHSVLSPQEKKELLAKYRLKDTQLPRIQLADPVARYYGLRRGQVVKIMRPSETAGRYVSYRLAL